MVPASFAYHRASTLKEAIAVFAAVEDGCFLAGGQSLVPIMNARQYAPRNIIDINAISALSGLSRDGGSLRIGALVRHSALCDASRLTGLGVPQRLADFLATAGRSIGNLAIRNRGTLGGSIALAEASAEWPLVMTLLEAKVITEGIDGRRECTISELRSNTLLPGEIITGIVVGLSSPHTRYGFSQTLLRHEGTRVTAVAQLSVEGNGRGVVSAVLSGLGAPPTRLPDIEVALDEEGGLLKEQVDFVSRSVAEAGVYHDDAFACQVAGTVAVQAISQALSDVRG